MENVGGLDRKIRMGLGAALVVLGAAGYAGLIPLAYFGPQ
ncbi:MAG: YgaP-like transmembrane domain, partial [Candidatus Nanohaloarchaea archaeon]